MKLKPADGRAVRDPAKGKLLPEDGAEVTLNAFWRRRLRDGDVVEVTADTASTTAAASTATTTASTATTVESTASTTASAADDTSEATS